METREAKGEEAGGPLGVGRFEEVGTWGEAGPKHTARGDALGRRPCTCRAVAALSRRLLALL